MLVPHKLSSRFTVSAYKQTYTHLYNLVLLVWNPFKLLATNNYFTQISTLKIILITAKAVCCLL